MYIINKIHMEQNLQCTCIKRKKNVIHFMKIRLKLFNIMTKN